MSDFEKGKFWRWGNGREILVRNFVREEEGGKLSMLIWVGASCDIMWVGAR